MQTVTITYYLGATPYSRTFNVYGVSPISYRLVKAPHEAIDGELRVNSAGYIPRFRIDFAPLGGSKESARWLAGMLHGTARQIEIDSVTYRVVPQARGLKYDFKNGVFFAERISIDFEAVDVVTVTDTGSTRILRPTYTPGVASISGQTLTLSVNLCDDISAESRGSDISYLDTTQEEEFWFQRHVFDLNIGTVQSAAARAWLLDYVLWGSIQLDTTLIDTAGDVYDVVSDEMAISWEYQNGIYGCPMTRLFLREKTVRTAIETTVEPFILDHDVLDSKPLG